MPGPRGFSPLHTTPHIPMPDHAMRLVQRQITAHTAVTMTPEKLDLKCSVGLEPQRRWGPSPPSMWGNVAVCLPALALRNSPGNPLKSGWSQRLADPLPLPLLMQS